MLSSGGVGTLAGFGVDLLVRLSPQASAQPGDLPLCALIAGWIRAQAQPDARTEVRVYAESHDTQTAVALGRRLRGEIDAMDRPTGVLIVADGANAFDPGRSRRLSPRRRRCAACPG